MLEKLQKPLKRGIGMAAEIIDSKESNGKKYMN